ncbi:MAG: molybdopterin-dependent oxidoreductase [Rhodospirillales bacterium]|nr:molybdopterin-dependent oxidoreductase [Rhodospirillales bacterium]
MSARGLDGGDGDPPCGVSVSGAIAFTVNGRPVSVTAAPLRRLADALRDDLGLTGTKVGCNAGDCGACTVLLDGEQVCSCMVSLAQAAGRSVETVEGLAQNGRLNRLQRAFLRHGAAQCGACTPGMLVAATEALRASPRPSAAEVLDSLGGVLCRCTGYRKIVAAVLDAAGDAPQPLRTPPPGAAVGARLAKLDGAPKLTGAERYGADAVPQDALWLRIVRSPHASARVVLGDMTAAAAGWPGVERVLTAADVPSNRIGIYPDLRDQPVLAEGVVRYRGDPVVALVGTREAVVAVRDDDLPIRYEPLPAVHGSAEAGAPNAPLVHDDMEDNRLIEGGVERGDAGTALAGCAVTAQGRFETAFVEHAYIEPEAGWARRVGDRVELFVSTQTPVMNRDSTAEVLGLAPTQVRIVPSACGGGFGGKLDVSVQPLTALAAWLTGKPVACVYERPESMMASPKRHPAQVEARMGCDEDGTLQAVAFDATFDTGAYASWGPTVAGRVPVHATGPYAVPAVSAHGRAVYTNGPPAGAFRGFGVPQAAIAHEALMDDLAAALGMDRLEIRLRNALRAGDATATGQVLEASAGLAPCLEALAARWQRALEDAARANAQDGPLRRGVGIGCMWYGIGNTALSNPSAMRITLDRDGRLTLHNGAVDIGQGSTTILAQICADALGVAVNRIAQVIGDTDWTEDAGKTSASRQTFVSGKAAEQAGAALRAAILREANAAEDAAIELAGERVVVRDGGRRVEIDLARLEADERGVVLEGAGSFDPPTTPLDARGQGAPYATYAFGAQIALVDVDTQLGTVTPLRIHAAHDVGRAINPTQVEGQIEGGIAQGIGLALMEEYLPGRTENLHDYLIPTIGDVPEIEVIIVEDPEPLGPFGAKGVGEPGLVPTAPAILGAIRHATGVRVTRVPALPHRLRAALREREARP